jgi:hypothetical protein
MIEETNTKASVPERWWHRLLRVLGYVVTFLVFAITLFLQLDSQKYYTYAYSFQDGYAAAPGYENTCHVYETLKDISCGEHNDPKGFIEFYLKSVGSEMTKPGTETIRDFVEGVRKDRGLSDWDIASGLISEKQYTYKMQSHQNARGVFTALAWATGVTLICFLLLAILYKTTLFIAYGHTRIKRVP